MGVHGLTTYLRENQRLIGTTHLLSSNDNKPHIPIVVDGWSFIYEIQQNSNLGWVNGGEYAKLSETVTKVVQAWLDIRLKVYFVFDGPCPLLKFNTAVSRLVKSNIQQSQLFFATSAASRNTSRFLRETRIIPPLAYNACLHALKAFGTDIEVHFADGEGDPYAVGLAGKLSAYVVGNDSDFVVLNSEGYRGYISLDEMVWSTVAEEPATVAEDDDFQPVRHSKGKKKQPLKNVRIGRGAIPPPNAASGLTLSFVSYAPSALADTLDLPVTLLPLLGALVGNDYSTQTGTQSTQSLFFEKSLSLSQRITKVASTIRGLMKGKLKKPVNSVMDLIKYTVTDLIPEWALPTMGSGQVESIIERVVDATLQYGIPADFPQHGPLYDLFSIEDEAEDSIGLLYLAAYRNGRLSNRILDILSTGTYWPRLFLENPEIETVGRSIGRDIRIWGYAILNEAVGLPAPPVDSSEDSDDDELIDVIEIDSEDSDVESISDPLAPLRALLQPGEVDESVSGSVTSSASRNIRTRSGSPVVTEYIRRGIRVAQEPVAVQPFADLLKSLSIPVVEVPELLSSSENNRFTLFLRILVSDVPLVRALSKEQLLPVLAARWVINILHRRATEDGASKDREKEKWTRHEASCFLRAFSPLSETTTGDVGVAAEPLTVTDRSVQIMAQVLMSIESVLHLSQIMLLSERVPDTTHLLSGLTFHANMSQPFSTSEPRSPSLMACHEGLEEAFGEVRKKKNKAKKNNDKTTEKVAVNSHKKAVASRRTLFELLGDDSA